MSIEKVLLTVLIVYLIWTIYEIFSLHMFKLKFFDHGIRIQKKIIKCRFSNWNNFDGIYYMKDAKYVFIPELKTGYFVTQFYFFKKFLSPFAKLTGFPLTLFGIFIERNNELIIEYKISYRLALLTAIWIVGWLVYPISSGNLINIGIGLTVILITLGIIHIRHIFLEGKMLIISDEIGNLLKIKCRVGKGEFHP